MTRLIDVDALKIVKFIALRNDYAKGWNDAVEAIVKRQPTIDAEPVRHGKWIEYPTADGMNQCSVCGVLRFGESNYCPNCGAYMKGTEDGDK